LIAQHFQVARLAAWTVFDQAQQGRACGRPTVRELDPWKVVQVAVLTRNQEARRNDDRLLVFVAVDVDVARALRVERIVASLKEPAAERRQALAAWAGQPAWEERDRHADAR
jgi:hypothetical protein